MIVIRCTNPQILGDDHHVTIEAYDHDDKVRIEIPKVNNSLPRLISQLQNQLPKGE